MSYTLKKAQLRFKRVRQRTFSKFITEKKKICLEAEKKKQPFYHQLRENIKPIEIEKSKMIDYLRKEFNSKMKSEYERLKKIEEHEMNKSKGDS
jgi:predicted nuclease with TOPRIM domain